MKILFMLVLLLGAGALGLSYYKNEKITTEFTKQIDMVSGLSHGAMTCSGFISAECTLEDISYQGKLLADSMTLSGIDPTVRPTKGEFISLPLQATIHNAKYSLFDISTMLKDDMQKELKSFFKKYTMDYDIHIDANFVTDGSSVRDVDIIDVDVQDKITPFHLQGAVSQLDTYPILNGLHASFDLSNKRVVFFDFMKAMRKCCSDKFPDRYLKMTDIEIWDDMMSQTVQTLEMNLKSQFNQGVEVDFMKALLAVLKDDKSVLDIDVISKKETPLEQTVMMFFIAGPDSVQEVYDIKVQAK